MSERTHRHELEKNLLAQWLGEKIEILRPYSIPLSVGGLIVVVAIVGAVIYFAQDNAGSARGWQTYFTAFGEPKVDEALKAAINNADVKGTAAEWWARLAYADRQFGLAAFQAAQDPTEAKAALADAEKALLEIEGKTQDALLLERCRFSLARVYETQNKLNRAREYYQKVAESSKDTPIGKAAADAVKRLDPSSEVTQVITWLAEQKPPAKKTPGSGLDSIFDGMGPFGPGPTLPERPNLSLPGTDSPFGSKTGGIDFGRDDPLGAKGSEAKGTEPDPDAPKTDDTAAKPGEGEKPKTEKPVDEKAPAEKPAGDAKPAKSPKAEPVESKP